MKPDASLLNELVNRILAVTTPTRIILFGSAARGEMNPNSDLDILVIIPSEEDCKQTSKIIYKNLIGFALAVDVIVATEDDVHQYGDSAGLIYRPALLEGRNLYAA
ncbi:MAG: nucleotidyltransferase domain-containing protein [Armatimonadota bacterium]|nr:nucleotidyltransferase domain-containing protein [bacterium]